MARNYSFFTIFSFEMICNFFDVSLSEKKKKIKKKKSLYPPDCLTKSGCAEVHAGDKTHDILVRIVYG